jgi:hypothetical protein
VGNAVARTVSIRSFFSLLYRFSKRLLLHLRLVLSHVMLRMAHENRILAWCDMAEALSKDVCRIHWARWRNRLQDSLVWITRKHSMSDVVNVVKPVRREGGTVTNTGNGNGSGNRAQGQAGRGRKRSEMMTIDSNNRSEWFIEIE